MAALYERDARRRLARGPGRGLGHDRRPWPTATCGRPAGPSRERLVAYARRRLHQAALRRGSSESQVAWTDQVLDPDALTIGFARRFATYKRATLLFRDLDRLRALLLDAERPVQLIFAGKAHPADDQGKELLQQVATMAADLDLRHRLVLLEDYDITVARMLVGGVDVWLNTPLRPLEACGTSGMKAVFNGVLNCSVLDGWWDEMYDGDVGWAIPSAEWEDDLDARNDIEAASVFNLLERQVVPLFYNRSRRAAGRVAAQGQGVDRPAGPAGRRRPHAARVHDRALRAGRRAHPARCGPTTTPGSRPSCAGAATSTAAGRRWRSPAPPTRSCPSRRAPPTGSPPRCRSATSIPSDVEVQLVYGAVDLDDELRNPTVSAMVEDGERRRTRAGAATPTSSTSTAPATSASPCASCRATPTCAATPTSARWPGPRHAHGGRRATATRSAPGGSAPGLAGGAGAGAAADQHVDAGVGDGHRPVDGARRRSRAGCR